MGNPAKLQSLAAISSCIQLVHEWASCDKKSAIIDIWKTEKDYGTCPDHEWFIWQLNEMQLPGSSVMPNLVLDQIEYHMRRILKLVTNWICHHHRKNFFHDEPASPLKEYVMKLVWKPDRSIDYAATAKNVLAGSNFNDMEKYRFACTYCFSEEACNLRDTAEITIDWCFETEPLLVYWSKYLANQLHTITLPANDSIDEIMFAKALNEYDLWQPMKYFFGKLNSGARLLQFNNVIKSGSRKHLGAVLALLNESEKSSVYEANLAEIIKYFIKVKNVERERERNVEKNVEGIRQIYTELKGKLSFKNLALIIEELAFWSMVTPGDFNALTPLLMEIWNDASDEDKRQVASNGLQSSIAEKWNEMIWEERGYYFDNRDHFRNPFVFIRALAEAYEPRNFLKSIFDRLVIWQPFASVLELIYEFQFNAEDVEELKNYIRQVDRMDDICSEFLEFGKLDDFSSFVSFWYSDDNANIISHRRDLLIDNLPNLSDALMYIDWRAVHEFVNNLFRDTDDGSVAYYTTQLMQYVLEEREYILIEMMEREDANSVVECIHTFVPYRYNLSEAKKSCIDALFRYLQNHNPVGYMQPFIFKEAQFEKMLIWCYGSETGVAKFKEKVKVSECFVNKLRSCVLEGTFIATDSMEEFLHWIYPLESERKAFKLKMIYSYGKFETIWELLKERRYRRRMLNWFFENDDYQIIEFTTKIYQPVGLSKQ